MPAGRGRVVRELLRALSERSEDGNRYVLYARTVWEEWDPDDRFTWRLINAADPWWHVLAARAANRACQVFLSTNSYLTPLFLRIPTVTIVYDLVTFEPAMRPNRRSALIERATLMPAARRSAAMLAISSATAQALERHLRGQAPKTIVALLGVRPDLGSEILPAQAAALPAPGFVLSVSTLEPRKNLPRLAEAYAMLEPELQRRHPLIVVGALGWETAETLGALRALGERCRILGHLSDAELSELYRRCAVFCYPSLGEGFGLPVLEAMAGGAAVITSNISSLPEVGGDAVDYVDPYDVTSIAAGLRAALSDEAHRRELARRSIARAQEFSWDRFADTTLTCLESCAIC